jgi:TatA/E family protein of Tat protein translocase
MPFNLGWPELLVVLAVALIIFGPKRLPEVGRSLGKTIREFRKATSEIAQEQEEGGKKEGEEPREGGGGKA